MHRPFMKAVLIALIAFPVNIAKAQDGEVAEIRSMMETMAELIQAKDVDSLDKFYASGQSVHIIEGAGVNHGWVDYRDHHLAPELAAFDDFSYRYFAIEPQIRGDFSFTAFRYELSADIDSGHIEIEGRGTAVMEKTSGQWKIVHLHTSGRPKRS